MTDAETAKLPLETTTVGAAGPHATAAFALLGNETRLAILLALWEQYDPHATDNIVSFSEIFDRVKYDDPGSFSYHLQQLTGQFIRQYADGEGYELRVPALRFIHAVIAGAGVQDATHEPTEIDQPCRSATLRRRSATKRDSSFTPAPSVRALRLNKVFTGI